MNLNEVWQQLNKEKLGADKPVVINTQMHSKHPVAKLKRAYLISTVFSLVILIGFIALLFVFDQLLVRVGLLCTIAGYGFFLSTNYSMFKSIKTEFPVDRDVKTALMHAEAFISANIRFQERTALFIYPVAATAGFLMGGAAAGAEVMLLMQKPLAIWSLVIFIAIATPLSWLLTRWLYNISYGVCLKQLKDLIHEMEKE